MGVIPFRPVFLEFDGMNMLVQPIAPARAVHLVIADLGLEADGQRVMDMLRARFHEGAGPEGKNLRRGLGEAQGKVVTQAKEAMLFGDGQRLGSLMEESQKIFDSLIAPIGAGTFDAPRLHGVLSRKEVRDLAWGGKKLGAASDGTVLFAAKGAREQRELLTVLRHAENLSELEAMALTIPGFSVG